MVQVIQGSTNNLPVNSAPLSGLHANSWYTLTTESSAALQVILTQQSHNRGTGVHVVITVQAGHSLVRSQPLTARNGVGPIPAQEISPALHLDAGVDGQGERAAQSHNRQKVPEAAAHKCGPAEFVHQKGLHEAVGQQVQQVQVERAHRRHLRAHAGRVTKLQLAPQDSCDGAIVTGAKQ